MDSTQEPASRAAGEHAPAGRRLRALRLSQRLSQLALAERIDVSTRHLSCVERGVARPGRALLLRWLEALQAPLAVRNDVLLAAGLAPAFASRRWDEPALQQVREAVARLLAAHDPAPAFVLDTDWRLVDANAGGRWLAEELLRDVPPAQRAALGDDMLATLSHPQGVLAHVVDLAEAGPAMLAHLRHEALAHPGLAPRVDAFAQALDARLRGRAAQGAAAAARNEAAARPLPPLQVTRYATRAGELAFFGLFTTFGAPQDVTLDSLRIEHLLPADGPTLARLAAAVG